MSQVLREEEFGNILDKMLSQAWDPWDPWDLGEIPQGDFPRAYPRAIVRMPFSYPFSMAITIITDHDIENLSFQPIFQDVPFFQQFENSDPPELPPPDHQVGTFVFFPVGWLSHFNPSFRFY
jgi:hypothetical protein